MTTRSRIRHLFARPATRPRRTTPSCRPAVEALQDRRRRAPGGGAGAAQGPHVAIRPLADDTRIGRCNRVTKGAIVAAIRAGHRSVEALGPSTCAGTGCGSCRAGLRKLLVASLSEASPGPRPPPGPPAAAPPPRARTTLLAVSAAALLLVLRPALARPTPLSDTVQGGRRLDTLWRERLGKQVSGFTLLGLSLFALALPLRKRGKRVSFGDFALWRLAHTVADRSFLTAQGGQPARPLGSW